MSEDIHTIDIYADGSLIGQKIEIGFLTNGGKHSLANSHVYICPTCGEPWRRDVMNPAPGWPTPQWQCWCKPCTSCGGGELMHDNELYDMELMLQYTSPAILRHEFLTRMEQLDANNSVN